MSELTAAVFTWAKRGGSLVGPSVHSKLKG
jgi:hypothetical protein